MKNRGTYIVSFQRNALLISLPILPPKFQPTQHHQDNIQKRTSNARVHSGLVPRLRVLLLKHQTARDAAQPPETHERGAAKGSLPLPAHVVCLEGHDRGHVAVCAGRDQEDAKVARAGLWRPAHDGEADEAEDHVEDDDGAADAQLVADPGGREHDDAGKGVGRCDEALGLANGEVHAFGEDQGQCISQCIGQGRGVEEHHGIGPDLPVQARAQELLQVERRDLSIAAVTLDAVHDPFALPLAEEVPGDARGIGEVDEQPVASDAEGAGQGAFDDEDPAPAGDALTAVEVHELRLVVRFCVAVSEETR